MRAACPPERWGVVLDLLGGCSGDGEIDVDCFVPSVGIYIYVDVGSVLGFGTSCIFVSIRNKFGFLTAYRCGYDGQCDDVTFFHCSIFFLVSVQR